MARLVTKTLFVCCSIVALSGCQIISSLHLTRNSHSQRAEQPQVAITTDAANQEARDHLRGGRTGLAIEAFNRALASGQNPAASYNGLGVAYARLGRTDLAYRFFNKAAMSDPQNQDYARNLTKLVDSPQFTLALMSRTAAPLVAAAPSPAGRQAVAARPPSGLQRTANRQFSLITLPPAGEALISTQRSAALTQCSRSTAKTNRACARTVLPTMQSRNAPEVSVAIAAVPETLTAAPAVSPAADGKRREFNFGRTPQTAPKPRHDGAAVAPANRRS